MFSWLSRPEKYRNLFARKGEKIPTSMLLLSTLTQRERVNHLPHLTPEKAGQLYEAYLRGELAEVQMVWKQMEDFDSTLGTVLHARQSALAEMTWRIETDDDLTAGSDELAALAAKQKAYLNALLRGVDNLEEALVHLGMADFRGVAAVELTGDRQRQVWSVIEPWNLTKPVLHGPWLYNAMADTVCPHPEELDEERVIIREARALDLAAMFLVLSKVHALQGWDGFLDIYGLPSVFAELPASIPEDQALEFDLVVKRMVGDGRGTVPNGTKFQTVETTKDNAQAFEQRAKWCDEAIIKLGLGGLLTVETQAGSGTLAGNAHADSFERLCAASARSISRAVDTQYCRRVLRAKFGSHTPILVHFVFGPQETEDRAAIATMLATLATAGYRAEDTVASDLLGIEITSANMDSTAIYAAKAAGYVPTQAAMQQRMGMPLKPAPAAEGSGVASPPMVANRAAAEGSGVASRAPEPQPDSAPLSAEELEAINALANGGLNQEQIAQDAATAANALAEAVQPSGNAVANTEEDGEDSILEFESFTIKDTPDPTTVENCNQYGHTPGCKVGDTINTLRETKAGTKMQGVIDALEANNEHPSNDPVRIKPVCARTAKTVEELCGRDISKHNHAISPSDLKHAKRRHSNLTDDDIMLMLDIQDNWDRLEYEKRNDIPKLVYTKYYEGKEYVLIERIGRTPRTPDKERRMHFTTLYKNE